MREAARGGGLFSLLFTRAERPRGFGGWGSRSTSPYDTVAPITCNSAIGDYALFLGIRSARMSRLFHPLPDDLFRRDWKAAPCVHPA